MTKPRGNCVETEYRFKDLKTAMEFQRTADYSLAVPKEIDGKINKEWEDAPYALGVVVSPYLAFKNHD